MLHEIFKSILHPDEIHAMFRLKFSGKANRTFDGSLEELSKTLSDYDFCYAVLNAVSRSFAVVIQQLPEELRDPVCIFYLVLRGLDSVEDDMDYEMNLKVPLLRDFYKKLDIVDWKISNVGDSADYRILLANFDKVLRVFKSLKPEYQEPIRDITKRMGNGMADFAEKVTVDTIKEYDHYCHYVAGLVGYGLSDLFAASTLEDKSISNEHQLSNSMGLFLQKCNIIRDYLEDLEDGRVWWPKEIWSQYANKLSSFRDKPYDDKSVFCLNHMVTDALRHVPDCMDYLQKLKDPKIFRFCAIPQLMSIATLAKVYNNPDVFQRVVKIRKGLSCKIVMNTNDMDFVYQCFHDFAESLQKSAPIHDPHSVEILKLCDQIKSRTEVKLPETVLRLGSFFALFVFAFVCYHLVFRYRERHTLFVHNQAGPMNIEDILYTFAGFTALGYLFGFSGVQYV